MTRSRISIIIIIGLITLVTITALRGIKIGNIEILSISKLIEKNKNLTAKIDEASILTSKDYSNNVETLEDTFNKYLVQKQKYEQLSGITSDTKDEKYETKQYDIGYLWRVLGKYATNRGLIINLDVQKNKKENNIYEFKFNVLGEYVKISQFITDIENDSDLYFRIYDFKMSFNQDKGMIEASFTVRNINIEADTIK